MCVWPCVVSMTGQRLKRVKLPETCLFRISGGVYRFDLKLRSSSLPIMSSFHTFLNVTDPVRLGAKVEPGFRLSPRAAASG